VSASNRNIVVTLSTVTAGFQQGINQATKGVQTFSQQIQGARSPLNQFGAGINKSAVDTTRLTGATLPAAAAITSFGNETEKAAGKSGTFAQKFAGNKGMIFGMLGMVSAGVEAIGMWGMYFQAQEGVAEAQAKVNKLVENGSEGTREHSQALQELGKQQKWVSMVTRNLVLSNFDMVFWSGMIVQGLSKQGGAMSKITGLFGKLKNAIHPTTAATTSLVTAARSATTGLGGMGAGAANAVAGIGGATIATHGLRAALIGIAGPLAIAAAGFAALVAVSYTVSKASLAVPELVKSKQAVDSWAVATAKSLGFVGEAFLAYRKGMIDAFPGAATPQELETKDVGMQPTVQEKHPNYQTDINEMTRRLMAGATIAPNTELITARKKEGVVIKDLNSVLKDYGYTVEESKQVTAEAYAGVIDYTGGIQNLGEAGIAPAKKMIAEMAPLLRNKTITMEQAEAATENYMNGLVGVEKLSEDEAKMQVRATMSHLKGIGVVAKMTEADKGLHENMKLRLMTAAKDFKMNSEITAKNNELHSVLVETGKAYFGLAGAEAMGNEQLIKGNAIIGATIDPITQMKQGIIDSAAAWDRVTPATVAATIADMDWIQANTDLSKILDGSKESTLLLAKARLDGTLATQAFVTETVLADEASKVMNEDLRALLIPTMELPGWIKFTNEQLQDMVAAMKTGGNVAAVLAGIVNEKLMPSFQTFSGILQAKNWKDFKEAFKGLEFGDAPKKFVGWFKDLGNNMRKVTEHARQANTVFDAMIVGIERGDLPVKTFKQGIGFIQSELKKIDKSATAPITKFLQDLKEGEDPAKLLGYADSMRMLFAALDKGGLSDIDQFAVIKQIAIDTAAMGEAATSANMPIDELSSKALKLVEQLSKGDILLPEYNQKMKELGIDTGAGIAPTSDLEAALVKMGLGGVEVRAKIDELSAALAVFQDNSNKTVVAVSNSIATLISNIKPHITTMNTYFGVTIPAAMAKSGTAADTLKGKIELLGTALGNLKFPSGTLGTNALTNTPTIQNVSGKGKGKGKGFPLDSPRDPNEYTEGGKNEFGGPLSSSNGLEYGYGGHESNPDESPINDENSRTRISGQTGRGGMPTSLPVIDQRAFQAGLQVAIENANQTIQIITQIIAKLASVKLPVIDQTVFQAGLQVAINNANQTIQIITQTIAKLASVKLPAVSEVVFQQGLQLAINNANQTVQIIDTTLAKVSSIKVPTPNESAYQKGLQLAINNAAQTVKFITTTLHKVSSIKVPAPNESTYQKGLQLAINNAAQTVQLIKKALNKISSISVPAPKFNNFNSALDQAVSDAKRAVRDINNALKQVNKAKPTGQQGAYGGSDTADNSYLVGGRSMYQNSDSSNGDSKGPYVFHFHIEGSELVPARTITKYIKRVSGSNIPSMQ